MIDFAELRRGMVDGQVRVNDVTDLRIVGAMLDIPRERFVPDHLRSLAYIDDDLMIRPEADGKPARYLMEPMVFAKLLQLADIQEDELVLDVAGGTGYPAAILSRLCGQVISVDDDAAFTTASNASLADLGISNVASFTGPQAAGWASEAPYDVIFINGAIEEVPASLTAQLKEGGRLVAVVGQGGAGRAVAFTKVGGALSERVAFNAAVPVLPAFVAPPHFTF